ncbi:MAG: hypothetical protein ABSB54_01835 [Acidimicrobiales bacterium]|jgi:hypothetical protein
MLRSTNIERALKAARIDLRPAQRQPSLASVGVATVVALGGSLGLDALLVALGTSLFPATRGFPHFRFSDYGLLTAIGVLLACAAWPVTTRVTSEARWLFLRLAVLVTVVLWLPDIWILVRGEPPEAVAVLMVMHLAIAVVTYNALVRIATLRPARLGPAGAARSDLDEPELARATDGADQRRNLSERRAVWLSMLGLVVLEFGLGVVTLLVVPAGRPSGWVPPHDTVVYALHTVVGALLAVGAIVVTTKAIHAERSVRVSAIVGLVGVGIGAVGGLLTVVHALRLLGMALMLAGTAVAVLGYVMPAVEPTQ